MKKNKRPQTPKGRNEAMNKAMLELRASNAAVPHANKSKYTRKDKSWKREI